MRQPLGNSLFWASFELRPKEVTLRKLTVLKNIGYIMLPYSTKKSATLRFGSSVVIFLISSYYVDHSASGFIVFEIPENVRIQTDIHP